MWWRRSYLYYVEDHILVETVEDALCDAVIAPRPVDQQKLLQVGELPNQRGDKDRHSVNHSEGKQTARKQKLEAVMEHRVCIKNATGRKES